MYMCVCVCACVCECVCVCVCLREIRVYNVISHCKILCCMGLDWLDLIPVVMIHSFLVGQGDVASFGKS